ncbi:aspartate aminotransferase family protein [Burkholderia diffusa]|uniref:Diaminobutyrate--2-oxoglutarate transaminase n=1 Tax=Burkholderia diffusa TaxID=488732 RepID=A0A6P2R5Z0_9BURK|nr:aminotransferase class III-fold pyridoxal phosphate-dependent enzyme [Burkholderia diffusa]MBM2656954.1 aspartate aminotransferase family protein [Burkholderia diffusa]VWC28145.1 acetylornithine aminotransferase [Burkholderia diffusa]
MNTQDDSVMDLSTAAPEQPFEDREETIAASTRYLASESGRLLRGLGADLIIGARARAQFQDAFSGKWYWNMHCNGGVFNMGHRNERLLQALRGALDTLDIGNHRFTSGIRAQAAQKLTRSTGGVHAGVVFNASGGEANDLAIRLARGVTGRQKVISIVGGYHGHTGIAISTTDPEFSAPFGGPLPGFVQVPWNNLSAMEAAIDDDTAAVVMETQPSSCGFLLPTDGYLQAVEKLCRDRGAMLLIDEVQTGMGRTGHVWSWQHHAIEPDIFVSGKGLSGGVYPMAATMMKQPIFDHLHRFPYGQVCTYGGNEIGSAVLCELLDMVDNPTFLGQVRSLSQQFHEGFADAAFDYWTIGLSGGIGRNTPDWALAAMPKLYEAGVWAVFSSFNKSALQCKPVMIMTAEEADRLIGVVKAALR